MNRGTVLRRLTLLVVASIGIAIGLIVYTRPVFIVGNVWPVIRRPILWGLGYTRYNFKPTADEAACYAGTIARHNAPGMTVEIPRTVHFVWGPGPNTNGTFHFTLYLAIRAALVTLRPPELKLHYSALDLENPWLKRLMPNITLVYHHPLEYLSPFLDLNSMNWSVAHQADVLRLTVLNNEGGTYFDADAFALRPMDKLLAGNRDVVMGHEGGNRGGTTNAVVLAKKGAPFVRRWLDLYSQFDRTKWSYHSVELPRELEKKYPDELCVLSPSAFFWPMWTSDSVDWLHAPLSPDEAREVEETVRRNGGSLFEDQLVVHAWSHAAAKYLERLSPEVIRNEDSRFNILMRPFLED